MKFNLKMSCWLCCLLVVSLCLPVDAIGQDGTDKPKSGEKEVKKPADDAAIEQVKGYIAAQTKAGKINKKVPTWKTRLPKFPDVKFTPSKNYSWNLKTNKGNISIKLLPKTAPKHCANFLYLTELGFFDSLKFHRVITGFMAQGGCPLGNGTGNPGFRFSGEYDSNVRHTKGGLLSMANAGQGTDGSQFFITFKATPWLDGKHTIFGEVTEGMETVRALENSGSPRGTPREPLSIEKAWITVN